jgi:hypothetical protein
MSEAPGVSITGTIQGVQGGMVGRDKLRLDEAGILH